MSFKTITTIEAACAANGTTLAQILPYAPGPMLTPKQKWLNACAVLEEAYTAVNKDEPIDYTNRNQRKWFPVFESDGAGFGFSHSSYLYDLTLSDVGSRLCCASEEKVEHIVEHFMEDYKIFIAHN